MNDHELHPIGDAARRSGLSVSAVRFYADAGLVEPAGLTAAGHRTYDVHAIARLELVRTLRELDTDLDEVRRLLDGGTTLHELLVTHLEIVERQEHTLRARRAVLKTLIHRLDRPSSALAFVAPLAHLPGASVDRPLLLGRVGTSVEEISR